MGHSGREEPNYRRNFTPPIGRALDFRDWSSNDVPLPKRDQLILVTNHPKQGELADGDQIEITISPAGTTKYEGATIRTYRYLGEYK
jgi:hypothetical protein